MARCAVFAQASRTEGFGLALAEALACGCPVVATDCPNGPREILEAGAHGRLVPVGDDEALAVALAATLDQPPDSEKLRTRATAFSLETAVESTLELLLGDAWNS